MGGKFSYWPSDLPVDSVWSAALDGGAQVEQKSQHKITPWQGFKSLNLSVHRPAVLTTPHPIWGMATYQLNPSIKLVKSGPSRTSEKPGGEGWDNPHADKWDMVAYTQWGINI